MFQLFAQGSYDSHELRAVFFVSPKVPACLQFFNKSFLPFLHPQLSVGALVFVFHAVFIVTSETQVTNESVYDETAVTPWLAPNRAPCL